VVVRAASGRLAEHAREHCVEHNIDGSFLTRFSAVSASVTAVSDDAVIDPGDASFQHVMRRFSEVRGEIERVLAAVDTYTTSLRVLAANSLAASDAISAFYGETDGRLGSSAVVHLHAVDEPFRNQCLALITKLQLAQHGSREAYHKIFAAFDSRIAMRQRAFKEFAEQQKRWKKTKSSSGAKRSADLTGSLVRFQMYNYELVDDMRLFAEQRHDPFDTCLMALLNVRFATDGLSEYDLAQKRALNDELMMKMLALKLPLTMSPAQITASLSSTLANHFGSMYFRKYAIAQGSVELLNFWESVQLRREIRRETLRAAEADFIYARYLGPSANPGVDVSQRALGRLLRRRETEASSPSLFDEAQAEVYARLETIFSAFLQAPEYDQLLNRVTFTSFNTNDNANEMLELARADAGDANAAPLLVPADRVPVLHFGTMRSASNSSVSSRRDTDGDPHSASSSPASSIAASPLRGAGSAQPPNVSDAANFARWKREQESQMVELTRSLTSPDKGAAALSRRPQWHAVSAESTDELASDLPTLTRESVIDIGNLRLPPLPPRPDEEKRSSAMARPSLSPRGDSAGDANVLALKLIDHAGRTFSSSTPGSRHSAGAILPSHSGHHRRRRDLASPRSPRTSSHVSSPRRRRTHAVEPAAVPALSSSSSSTTTTSDSRPTSPRSPRSKSSRDIASPRRRRAQLADAAPARQALLSSSESQPTTPNQPTTPHSARDDALMQSPDRRARTLTTPYETPRDVVQLVAKVDTVLKFMSQSPRPAPAALQHSES
jgi:hypothetical protein